MAHKHTQELSYGTLRKLYLAEGKSSADIAQHLQCSEHKVNYWLLKHNITKRSISEAIYKKYHPKGDPFHFIPPHTLGDERLFGLGLGLYWGEGNKANKNVIKIGNSDPALLRIFMKFLERYFQIHKDIFKFHLHTFSDINTEEARRYWMRELGIKRSQFYKPFVTKTGALGTYRKKSKYGVLTLYYANTKARNLLMNLLDKSA